MQNAHSQPPATGSTSSVGKHEPRCDQSIDTWFDCKRREAGKRTEPLCVDDYSVPDQSPQLAQRRIVGDSLSSLLFPAVANSIDWPNAENGCRDRIRKNR